VLWIFIALKNELFWARFEPVNFGSNGKHVTTRPLRVKYYTVKLGYNDHGCNEVMAIAKKCYLQVTFTSI
jgi:hypothetical protein